MNVGKLDYESRQEKNAPDVCRCQQWEPNLIFPAKKQQIKCKKPRDSEGRTDSAKSEEEAATTIQAVYRGYKARRRFDEIRKTTSEGKSNVKKVAELLAIPVERTLYKRSECIRISNSSASQGENEKDRIFRTLSPRKKRYDSNVQRNQDRRVVENQAEWKEDAEGSRHDTCATRHTPREQRNPRTIGISENLIQLADASKPIKMIKSPAFFSNYDERTSSVSPSDNTDVDEPFSPRIEGRSMPMDLDGNTRRDNNVTSNNGTDCQAAGDDAQRGKPRSNEIQTRFSNYIRPLPQRISSSILGSNADRYFLDNSLFYPDRESVLVFGGFDPHEEYSRAGNTGKDIYRFKPDENIWEFVGEIPEARHHHSVAYLKGRVYVVGGADPREDKLHRKSIAVGNVFSYDPTTRTWFNEPGMLTARKDFGLVVSHGKMYAMGGQGRNGIALKTVEAFDPSDCTWREMQPMQTARVGPASVKYRDLIWVAGGMTKSKKELFSKDVECYDPIKNLWLKAVSLRSPRCFASFYVLSDCLYVIGGASTTENGTRSIDSLDVWDPNACVWREEANMSIARHGHCTGSIGDQLLIIGGVTTVFMKTLNNVECYCCEIGKWIKGVSALPHAISGHGTVSLPPANLLMDH